MKKKNPTVSGFVKEKINWEYFYEQAELYANMPVCQEFQKNSKDEATRKAEQNQEWGTTRNQNPKSNSNQNPEKKSQKPESTQKSLKKTGQVKKALQVHA